MSAREQQVTKRERDNNNDNNSNIDVNRADDGTLFVYIKSVSVRTASFGRRFESNDDDEHRKINSQAKQLNCRYDTCWLIATASKDDEHEEYGLPDLLVASRAFLGP